MTGDQRIVGDPVVKVINKISYTRIKYAEVKIRSSSSRFVFITLYLEPAENQIILNPRSAKRTREFVPPSYEFVLPKLVLKKISHDASFIAVLASKGNVKFMLK